MLARLTAELEEREAFQNGLVEAAQAANRDLNSQEMELYERAGARMHFPDVVADVVGGAVRF